MIAATFLIMKTCSIAKKSESFSLIFSIITPTYNRAWCIERAMKSVLAQDFQDWEMIIVDDGSTDNTKDIVEEYLSDARIRYFYKENGGVGSARNIGIENARGKYFIFLDSDDTFFTNDSLACIYKTVNENADILYFGFGTVDENGAKMSFMEGESIRAMLPDILRGIVSGEFLPCVRADIFKNFENRFPEDVNGGEGLLWWKIMRNNSGAFFSFPARTYFLDASNSIVRSLFDRRIAKNVLRINQKVLDEFGIDMKRCNRKMYCSTVLVLLRMLLYQRDWIVASRLIWKNPICMFSDTKKLFLVVVAVIDFRFYLTNFLIRIFR